VFSLPKRQSGKQFQKNGNTRIDRRLCGGNTALRQTNETQNTNKETTMNSHKAEIINEVKNMTSRLEIESRMNAEENTTVQIWIWQYLQTL